MDKEKSRESLKICYLVLAHKNPQQLNRLIRRLNYQDCFFYIHIDKNSDITDFKNEITGGENIHFIDTEKRQPSLWGDIGLVMATLKMLEQVVKDNRNGYCVLLSGQDYPVKSNSYIKSFFAKNYPTDFINHFSLPCAIWSGGGLDRLTKYKVNHSDKRGDFLILPSLFEKEFYSAENINNITKLWRSSQFNLKYIFFKRRKFPAYIQPYGGSQWWTLTTSTVTKIFQFIAAHPDYIPYHNYTLFPDEIFFQSIIMDIHKHSRDKVAETITYMDWNKPNVPLPATFTIEDFPALNGLPFNALFARKFDTDKDERILDELDKTAE